VSTTDILHRVQLLEANIPEMALVIGQDPQKYRLKFDSHCIFLGNFRGEYGDIRRCCRRGRETRCRGFSKASGYPNKKGKAE
jgi:hypothetical protein